MNLPFFIARRYLFAKKSHNVINIISAISAIGMAIGTAALIIILSVYNGFDALIKDNLSSIAPDLLVTPVQGKSFIPEGDAFEWMKSRQELESATSYIQESVFINYDGHQSLAVAKGVEPSYEELTSITEHVRAGEFSLRYGEIPLCAVGAGLAYEMGINPRFMARVEIYYPDKDKRISLSNPASALNCIKVRPSCTFSINSDEDNSLIILPFDEMRELLGYGDEVSGIELRLDAGCSPKQIKEFTRELQSRLGPGFKVSDRYHQNESLYKMMRYEKAAIFLILIFIIIIIAFNIFGSLSMLIIEKQGDISTLRSLGATDRLVRRTFILEGWLISLLGLAAGLAAGLGISLLQQHFGLIKMPGNYLISSYPVIIERTDVLLTAIGVAAIGYIIAMLPVASYCKND